MSLNAQLEWLALLNLQCQFLNSQNILDHFCTGKSSIGVTGVRSKCNQWSTWLLRCKYALSLCAILL